MKRSVEIVGQPIISITEGKEFGHVKELLINNTNGTVAALVIDDGKWYQGAKLLPFEAIAGLGEYAVTINNSQNILTLADRPEFETFFAAGVKIIGTKVLTKGGKIEGKINEFTVDNSGKINICELEKTEGEIVDLAAQKIVTFGKEVLIISDEEVTNAAPAANQMEIPAVAAAPVEPEPVVVTPVEETIPAPQVEVPAAPVEVAKEKEQQPADDSAKKFDDKHRKFLLGKKAARRIETDNGIVIIEQGGEVTEEVLQKAKLAGKFVELSMNIQ